MKKRIICGLCLFFVLTSVILLIPLRTAAENDHSGKTQVIARIRQPSDEQTTEHFSENSTSGSTDEPPSSENDTFSTGDMSFLLTGAVTAAAVFSLGLMIVAWKDESDPADTKLLSGKIKNR